jgi:hypothetical protein
VIVALGTDRVHHRHRPARRIDRVAVLASGLIGRLIGPAHASTSIRSAPQEANVSMTSTTWPVLPEPDPTQRSTDITTGAAARHGRRKADLCLPLDACLPPPCALCRPAMSCPACVLRTHYCDDNWLRCCYGIAEVRLVAMGVLKL